MVMNISCKFVKASYNINDKIDPVQLKYLNGLLYILKY